MSPEDFASYEKLFHYRSRAYDFGREAKLYFPDDFMTQWRLKQIVESLNVQMTRLCGRYRLKSNRKGQDVNSFIRELNGFLDQSENSK